MPLPRDPGDPSDLEMTEPFRDAPKNTTTNIYWFKRYWKLCLQPGQLALYDSECGRGTERRR